jgi:hypothetical protein
MRRQLSFREEYSSRRLVNGGNRPLPSLIEKVCPGRDELDGRSLPRRRRDTSHSKLYPDRYSDSEKYLRVLFTALSYFERVFSLPKRQSLGLVSEPSSKVKTPNEVLTVKNVYGTHRDVASRSIKHEDPIEPCALVIDYDWGRNRGMKKVEGGSISPIREPKALAKSDDVGVGQGRAILGRDLGERGMKSLGHYGVPVYPSSLHRHATRPPVMVLLSCGSF